MLVRGKNDYTYDRHDPEREKIVQMRHLKGLEVGEEADDGDVLDGKGQAEAVWEEECFGDDQDSSDGSGNGDDWDKKRRSRRQLQQHKSIYLDAIVDGEHIYEKAGELPVRGR